MMIAAVLKNPSVAQDLKDWGVIPTMLEGESHTSGIFNLQRRGWIVGNGGLGMHARFLVV